MTITVNMTNGKAIKFETSLNQAVSIETPLEFYGKDAIKVVVDTQDSKSSLCNKDIEEITVSGMPAFKLGYLTKTTNKYKLISSDKFKSIDSFSISNQKKGFLIAIGYDGDKVMNIKSARFVLEFSESIESDMKNVSSKDATTLSVNISGASKPLDITTFVEEGCDEVSTVDNNQEINIHNDKQEITICHKQDSIHIPTDMVSNYTLMATSNTKLMVDDGININSDIVKDILDNNIESIMYKNGFAHIAKKDRTVIHINSEQTKSLLNAIANDVLKDSDIKNIRRIDFTNGVSWAIKDDDGVTLVNTEIIKDFFANAINDISESSERKNVKSINYVDGIAYVVVENNEREIINCEQIKSYYVSNNKKNAS